MKLLSILAAIRLDYDDIEETLEAELLDSSSSAIRDRSSEKFDPLSPASDSWKQVHLLLLLDFIRWGIKWSTHFGRWVIDDLFQSSDGLIMTLYSIVVCIDQNIF